MNDTYLGGLPYGPDIKRLRDRYRETELKVGETISYQEVADVINVVPKSARFYAVTRSWRSSVEKDSGLFIQPSGDGESFKVFNDSEKFILADREDKTAFKKTKRALVVLKSIDEKELTDSEKSLYGFKKQRLGKVFAIQQIKTPQALPDLFSTENTKTKPPSEKTTP